jgi:uncharacterized membrane protein/mono/diheme cytochrome c family protein
MNRLIEMSGHFHPVLVHLPIGFLLLALVFQFLGAKEKYAQLQSAVRISFLLGAISAVFSCLTGLSLSSGGDYDPGTLQFHKWFGIAVALISFIGYWFSFKPLSLTRHIIAVTIFILLIITGHLGGTLTHGEGFLTKGWQKKETDGSTNGKVIADIQQAVVFKDIVQPILDQKCGGCHSAKKQKGGLRIDAPEWILKGGKDGLVYIAGDAASSELYKRIVLDPLEEKHMPPKGKPQLSEQETNLIRWWIDSHAGFEKKVSESQPNAQVTAALHALQSSAPKKASEIPTESVAAVSPAILEDLRKAGIAVVPVAANSNYLQASFLSMPHPGDTVVALLKNIRKQLVWLKVPGAKLNPGSWQMLGGYTNLTRLDIAHSNINDATIMALQGLEKLQYLNLVGTAVSAKAITQLKKMTALTQLYLGQTRISHDELVMLKQQFPKTYIDSGNYQVANLVTDTQLLKAPPVKK